MSFQGNLISEKMNTPRLTSTSHCHQAQNEQQLHLQKSAQRGFEYLIKKAI